MSALASRCRYDRALWESLACSWGLELTQMPGAMQYLWARVQCEDGLLDFVQLERWPGHYRLIYQDVDRPSRRYEVDRPRPWRRRDEERALRQMRGVLGEGPGLRS